jgi:hypothetical protein
VLDANEYFLKGSGSPRPVIQQNIFGGSLGGPVSPGGKLGFFFVNYQGTRQRSGDSPGTLISTFIPYVPATDRGAANAANLAADFGVPSADPLAVNLLSFQSSQFGAPANGYLYPLPNVTANPGDLVQFTVSKPGSSLTISSRRTGTTIFMSLGILLRRGSSSRTRRRMCPSARAGCRRRWALPRAELI